MEIRNLEKSEIEITGEIGTETFSGFWKKAVKKLSNEVKIDGFRTGNIPEEILVRNLGENAILDEAAELSLRDEYQKIIVENKIEAIGRPKITITKIARGNPLGYKITTAVLPIVSLPDFKKIARKILGEESQKEIKIEPAEIKNVIDELRRIRAKSIQDGSNSASQDASLPEFNDELVKSLGDFDSVEDFKNKLEENLKLEKQNAAKESVRSQIIQEIDKGSKMEVPDILISGEQNKMVAEYKSEVTRQGLNWDEYLKNIKKNEEEIKKETEELAKKRVRFNLILKNIAKVENIKVPEDDVTKEAEKLVKAYAGADLDSAKMYVEDIMLNAKVFEFLES